MGPRARCPPLPNPYLPKQEEEEDRERSLSVQLSTEGSFFCGDGLSPPPHTPPHPSPHTHFGANYVEAESLSAGLLVLSSEY